MQSEPVLSNRRFLVVEDQSLIALELEAVLVAAGAGTVAIATDLPRARALLDGSSAYDAAILDLQIGKTHAVDLALDIARRGIPIVFASGYGDATGLPSPLDRCPFISKPFSEQGLLDALRRCMATVPD